MADFTRDFEAATADVPSQRLRTAAKGLSFNTADEIEAYLTSLFSSKPYNEALEEIRSKVKAYQEAQPVEAAAYEIGGAFAPAVLAAPFTGGGSLATVGARFPALVRVSQALGFKNPETFIGALTAGGAQGMISGFAEGEGGVGERVKSGLQGGILGTGVAGAVEVGSKFSKPLFVGFADVLRRKFGSKVGGRVEQEIQQIARDNGLSVDDVTQQILDGRILADNKTIAEAVRSYRAGSMPASEMAERRLRLRPQQKQQELISDVEKYLGGVQQPSGPTIAGQAGQTNLLQKQLDEINTLKIKVDELYNGEWAQNPVDDQTFNFVRGLYKLAPNAFKEVNETRQMRGLPLIKADKDGNVVMPNSISIEEAELIRRALSNLSEARFKKGKGTTGVEASNLEGMLRQRIDNMSDETRQARQTYADMSRRTEAYEAGQKLWTATPNPDALEVEWLKVLARNNEDEIRAFRLGVLTKLRGQLRNAPTGTSKKITNEQTDASLAFSIIFPEQNKDEILRKMTNAVDAQEAANMILGGSPTQITKAYQDKQGASIGISDLSLDVAAIAGLAMKVLSKTKPDLSDFEKRQVVDILTSSDVNRVRQVLQDESGFQSFVKLLDRIHETAKLGSRRAGAQYVGSEPEQSVQTMTGLVQ